MFFLRLLTLFVCASVLLSAPAEDEVTSLPGADFEIKFKHYSGYVTANKPSRKLHYWFVESQNDPKNDPLVLWLNGGPGCSSVMGMMTENGPFYINDDGHTLYENEYSWNKLANFIYLESPACVGFSYDEDSKFNCKTGDTDNAESNYEALKNFFKKFPEYKDHDFFITGESYGGLYVPMLVEKILQNQDSYHINLKGYAVGNGMSDYSMNADSFIYFAKYHGLIGTTVYNKIMDNCCDNDGNCVFHETPETSQACLLHVRTAVYSVLGGDLNMYNIYEDCYYPPEESKYSSDIYNLFMNYNITPSEVSYSLKDTLKEPRRRAPCVNSWGPRTYLNNKDVREALHIPDVVPDWAVCNTFVNLFFKREFFTMKAQYEYNLQHVRALLFNGDVDCTCNFVGQEWFVESLGRPVVKERRKWFEGKQIAGYVKDFEGVTVATVLGAGHMAPTDKPSRTFMLFKSFLDDTML